MSFMPRSWSDSCSFLGQLSQQYLHNSRLLHTLGKYIPTFQTFCLRDTTRTAQCPRPAKGSVYLVHHVLDDFGDADFHLDLGLFLRSATLFLLPNATYLQTHRDHSFPSCFIQFPPDIPTKVLNPHLPDSTRLFIMTSVHHLVPRHLSTHLFQHTEQRPPRQLHCHQYISLDITIVRHIRTGRRYNNKQYLQHFTN